jgi:hypothetical protein
MSDGILGGHASADPDEAHLSLSFWRDGVAVSTLFIPDKPAGTVHTSAMWILIVQLTKVLSVVVQGTGPATRDAPALHGACAALSKTL